MEFGWEPAKDAITRQRRGFGFRYVSRIFAGRAIESNDRRRDYGEERVKAIGEIDGRVYVVIFTDRGSVRWIITAWKASGRDVKTWRAQG